MKHLKMLCLLILTIMTVGIAMTATANAAELPSVNLEGATTGTLTGTSTTAKTKFTGIRNLEGTGWKFTLESAVAKTSLGVEKLEFKLVKLNVSPTELPACSTAGDATETVLIPTAQWHTVLSLTKSSILFLLLSLIPLTKITCGSLVIEVQGDALADAGPFGTAVATTGVFAAETGKCSGVLMRNPAYTEYINDAGAMIKPKLESNVGLGFEESCEEIEGKLLLAPSVSMTVKEP
jgi:hypothetical protein